MKYHLPCRDDCRVQEVAKADRFGLPRFQFAKLGNSTSSTLRETVTMSSTFATRSTRCVYTRVSFSPASRRAFNVTRPAMVDAKSIKPSGSEEAQTLATEATQLVDNGRWQLWNEGRGLERQFRFKTFKATWVPNPSSSPLFEADIVMPRIS